MNIKSRIVLIASMMVTLSAGSFLNGMNQRSLLPPTAPQPIPAVVMPEKIPSVKERLETKKTNVEKVKFIIENYFKGLTQQVVSTFLTAYVGDVLDQNAEKQKQTTTYEFEYVTDAFISALRDLSSYAEDADKAVINAQWNAIKKSFSVLAGTKITEKLLTQLGGLATGVEGNKVTPQGVFALRKTAYVNSWKLFNFVINLPDPMKEASLTRQLSRSLFFYARHATLRLLQKLVAWDFLNEKNPYHSVLVTLGWMWADKQQRVRNNLVKFFGGEAVLDANKRLIEELKKAVSEREKKIKTVLEKIIPASQETGFWNWLTSWFKKDPQQAAQDQLNALPKKIAEAYRKIGETERLFGA